MPGNCADSKRVGHNREEREYQGWLYWRQGGRASVVRWGISWDMRQDNRCMHNTGFICSGRGANGNCVCAVPLVTTSRLNTIN